MKAAGEVVEAESKARGVIGRWVNENYRVLMLAIGVAGLLIAVLAYLQTPDEETVMPLEPEVQSVASGDGVLRCGAEGTTIDFVVLPLDGSANGWGFEVADCPDIRLDQAAPDLALDPDAVVNLDAEFHLIVRRCAVGSIAISDGRSDYVVSGDGNRCTPEIVGPFRTNLDGSVSVTIEVTDDDDEFSFQFASHRG